MIQHVRVGLSAQSDTIYRFRKFVLIHSVRRVNLYSENSTIRTPVLNGESKAKMGLHDLINQKSRNIALDGIFLI